jgi:hypothetical protein
MPQLITKIHVVVSHEYDAYMAFGLEEKKENMGQDIVVYVGEQKSITHLVIQCP